ncbi:hypothetical protein [Oricola indica]|uniref:hypothetical protein n=1 Tax=Oricola indica TaxID=2872591 RepID=UPI001CBD66EE|nr:hypothetical protein [Oricola indica]
MSAAKNCACPLCVFTDALQTAPLLPEERAKLTTAETDGAVIVRYSDEPLLEVAVTVVGDAILRDVATDQNVEVFRGLAADWRDPRDIVISALEILQVGSGDVEAAILPPEAWPDGADVKETLARLRAEYESEAETGDTVRTLH